MTRDCPGATMRLSTRPHTLCRQCDRFAYAIEGRTPRLIDDGVATCPDRIHDATVRLTTQSRAPTCGGSERAGVGVHGNTGVAG